jgi:ribosome-associated translation inhibitor RaiA
MRRAPRVSSAVTSQTEGRLMKLPVQISFKDMQRDEEIAELIKEKVAKLDRVFGDMIIQCRVTVAMPHRSHRTGNFYDMTVNISVPDKEIENKDFRHVAKERFERAFRLLEDYKEKRNAA